MSVHDRLRFFDRRLTVSVVLIALAYWLALR
jgi:hypothetical protein